MYITLNSQITQGKCQRSTWESARRSVRTAPNRWLPGSVSLHCVECQSALLCMLNFKSFFLLSVVHWIIALPHAVQQETEWWWCQLPPGERWGQWTGNVSLLSGFIHHGLIWRTRSSSGCLWKDAPPILYVQIKFTHHEEHDADGGDGCVMPSVVLEEMYNLQTGGGHLPSMEGLKKDAIKLHYGKISRPLQLQFWPLWTLYGSPLLNHWSTPFKI